MRSIGKLSVGVVLRYFEVVLRYVEVRNVSVGVILMSYDVFL